MNNFPPKIKLSSGVLRLRSIRPDASSHFSYSSSHLSSVRIREWKRDEIWIFYEALPVERRLSVELVRCFCEVAHYAGSIDDEYPFSCSSIGWPINPITKTRMRRLAKATLTTHTINLPKHNFNSSAYRTAAYHDDFFIELYLISFLCRYLVNARSTSFRQVAKREDSVTKTSTRDKHLIWDFIGKILFRMKSQRNPLSAEMCKENRRTQTTFQVTVATDLQQ